MAAIRRASEGLVLAVQWALSVVLFESGLVQAGLPVDELQARFGLTSVAGEPALAPAGLAQAVAAVLLVAPTTSRFVPALAPLVAVVVAVAFGAAASGSSVPVGLGAPSFALAVALTAGALAVARGVLLPIAALDLGPEGRDPWRRRQEQASRPPPSEQPALRPEPTSEPADARADVTPPVPH